MSPPSGTTIVTGATGGMGSAIVSHIMRRSDLADTQTGIYTVRKPSSAPALRKALQSAPSSHKHEVVGLDLSSIKKVRAFAKDINERVASGAIPPIRALILNAGYQDHTELNMTSDGYEMTWQVNYLANFLLALLLLQSMDKKEGRILIVGSWTHDVDDDRNRSGGQDPYSAPHWNSLFPDVDDLARGRWSTPQDDPSWLSGFRRYGASKLCVVMLQQELARRMARDPALSHIAVIGLDPGAMSSDLLRRGSFFFKWFLSWFVLPVVGTLSVRLNPNGPMRTTWKSGGDAVRACFDMESPAGQPLYLNGTDEFEVAKDAQDETKRRKLWAYGLQAGGIREGDTVLEDWK